MPQPTTKKKATSNGRIPAYQNKFAFRHNPKSKKTATILAAPIEYCCQRCYDKIVWRKQYRKYKPLTQPATCNMCHKRNITAAYHTICNTCSISHPKAVALLHEWNHHNAAATTTTTTAASTATTVACATTTTKSATTTTTESREHTTTSSSAVDRNDLINITNSLAKLNHNINGIIDNVHDDNEEEEEADDDDNSVQEGENIVSSSKGEIQIDTKNETNVSISSKSDQKQRPLQQYKRVCTICCKQPALPDDDSSNDDTNSNNHHNNEAEHGSSNRPLKLRQIKSLQRQKEKQQQDGSKKSKRRSSQNIDSNSGATEQNEREYNEREQDTNDDNNSVYNSDDDDDDEYNHNYNEDENCDTDDDNGDGKCTDEDEKVNRHANHDWNNNSNNNMEQCYTRTITDNTTRPSSTITFDTDDDRNDPFLQAIGGAKNLLVGEAYQKMLLEKKM